ncbi:MAG: recombinase family protein, partial [Mycobacterium sp.]
MADASVKRVFADVPLGTERVYQAFARLDPDRQRAVINVLMTATILPVGKRGRVPFDPERIAIEWLR